MDDLSDITLVCCKEEESSKTFQIFPFFTCQTKIERNAISTLIQISEEISEEDGKFMHYPFRTGWEEAVHGWERASPFACLYPQKKLQKSKYGEVYHCTLCTDLAQLPEEKRTLETKSVIEYSKEVSKPPTKPKTIAQNLSQCADGEVLNSSEMQTPLAYSCGDGIESNEQDKSDAEVYLTHSFQNDVKPLKEEDVQQQEKSHTYSMMRFGEKKTAKKGRVNYMCGVNYVTNENLAFSCFAVLPPLKPVVPNDFLDFSVKKNKIVTPENEEKTQYKASAGVVGHAKGLQMPVNAASPDVVADALRRQLRGENVLPAFVPLDLRTQILTDKDHWNCQCSLMPGKASSVIPNASISKPSDSASTQSLLHPRTIQYCKRNAKKDELSRGPFSTSGRSDNGSEQRRNRMGGVDVPVPLLPELLVTRVAIPAVPYRLL